MLDHGELHLLRFAQPSARYVGQPVQRGGDPQHLGGRRSPFRFLGEHARDQVGRGARDIRQDFRQGWRILEHQLGYEHAGFVPAKGGLSGQTLVHHAAQGEDVGPTVDADRRVYRLGRQVARRAHQVARAGEPPPVGELGNAEIEQLELAHLAFEQEQVLRLDIAVYHVVGMRVGQRLGRLPEQD